MPPTVPQPLLALQAVSDEDQLAQGLSSIIVRFGSSGTTGFTNNLPSNGPQMRFIDHGALPDFLQRLLWNHRARIVDIKALPEQFVYGQLTYHDGVSTVLHSLDQSVLGSFLDLTVSEFEFERSHAKAQDESLHIVRYREDYVTRVLVGYKDLSGSWAPYLQYVIDPSRRWIPEEVRYNGVVAAVSSINSALILALEDTLVEKMITRRDWEVRDARIWVNYGRWDLKIGRKDGDAEDTHMV